MSSLLVEQEEGIVLKPFFAHVEVKMAFATEQKSVIPFLPGI